MAPTLLLLSSQSSLGVHRVSFDEGYLAKQGQLWVKYDSSRRNSFQGVLATPKKQSLVRGTRQGNQWWIQEGKNIWQGVLNRTSGCEGQMSLRISQHPSEQLLLKSNFCLSKR
jgi:hypothetical protein